TTKNDTHVLLGELGPCSSSDKQTCLKSVVLLTDQRKNIVVFKSDGSILLNEMEIHLPYRTGSFSIYQPSSFYTIVHTNYGLKMQIQLSPVMQLFLIMEDFAKGTLQGLCGDYNGVESDDLKASGGVVEATGASFANSWKAQASCSDMEDKLEHPCSLSLENDKEVTSCPANQVFHYNLTTCQQSCRSLSDGDKYCLKGFTAVDGCGCPDNTYVNEKGICVSMSDCSCYYKGLYTQPRDSIMKDDKR
ncbi:mucin-2-like, partial [Pseudonaja textilis]|uniref:mucin-2-like n=1 Tax=Pseudonaja textilis TaxID=8673 RepID=UPI000EAA1107